MNALVSDVYEISNNPSRAFVADYVKENFDEFTYAVIIDEYACCLAVNEGFDDIGYDSAFFSQLAAENTVPIAEFSPEWAVVYFTVTQGVDFYSYAKNVFLYDMFEIDWRYILGEHADIESIENKELKRVFFYLWDIIENRNKFLSFYNSIVRHKAHIETLAENYNLASARWHK